MDKTAQGECADFPHGKGKETAIETEWRKRLKPEECRVIEFKDKRAIEKERDYQ